MIASPQRHHAVQSLTNERTHARRARAIGTFPMCEFDTLNISAVASRYHPDLYGIIVLRRRILGRGLEQHSTPSEATYRSPRRRLLDDPDGEALASANQFFTYMVLEELLQPRKRVSADHHRTALVRPRRFQNVGDHCFTV